MKKTEILKVRVDQETHAALMRYCQDSRRSPSHVLREMLGQLVQEGNPVHGALAGNSEAAKEARAHLARGIAAILLAEQLSMTGRQPPRNKARELTRLVDALLQAVAGNHDQEPTPPPFRSEEKIARASGPEPKYG
jgi:predicted trehalose synthase